MGKMQRISLILQPHLLALGHKCTGHARWFQRHTACSRVKQLIRVCNNIGNSIFRRD
ncbi:hypothetical protein AKJ16_DCAP18332 [Drosera capensis]